ncbi:MAG: hypothetical protein AVDCRST_MAG64-516, partial [uncultured Phycisphaerae bacterium]
RRRPRHAVDRHARLHRLRRVRRPLRQGRAAHDRRQGDGRPAQPQQVRPRRRVRRGLPDRRRRAPHRPAAPARGADARRGVRAGRDAASCRGL